MELLPLRNILLDSPKWNGLSWLFPFWVRLRLKHVGSHYCFWSLCHMGLNCIRKPTHNIARSESECMCVRISMHHFTVKHKSQSQSCEYLYALFAGRWPTHMWIRAVQSSQSLSMHLPSLHGFAACNLWVVKRGTCIMSCFVSDSQSWQ